MTTDQRLARLERQNARMKVAVAGMAVVLAVVLLIGAGQEKDKSKVLEEVRAKQFVLVDGQGMVHGCLQADPTSSSLSLIDARGGASVQLVADSVDDVSGLRIWHDQKPYILLGRSADGISMLGFFDGDETKPRPRVVLQHSDKDSHLLFLGEDGNAVCALPPR